MNETVLNAIKVIFLFGFTLHNMEEAIWLPQWSKYARQFHEPVETNQFIFAVIVVTMIGYVLTAVDFLAGGYIHYIYLGFVGMMGLNAIFPHLIATIALKKYAPGLITALFLNLPFSLILIVGYIQSGLNKLYLFVAIIIVSGIVLFSLKYLFKLGKILIDYPDRLE